MTPEQIEVLKPGYEVHTFRVSIKTDPPYGLESVITKGRVVGITRGGGRLRIHTVPFDSDPASPPESVAYSPGEVYTSASAAAKGCLECVDGIAKGIGDLKRQVREASRTDKAAATALMPRRRGGRPRQEQAAEAPAATTTEDQAPAPEAAAEAFRDPIAEGSAEAGAEEAAPVAVADAPVAEAPANGRRGRKPRTRPEPAPELEAQEAPVAAEDASQEIPEAEAAGVS